LEFIGIYLLGKEEISKIMLIQHKIIVNDEYTIGAEMKMIKA